MVHSEYLDKLRKDNKYEDFKKQLWEQQSHTCFICNREIDLDFKDTAIDHIIPISLGGKNVDDPQNFAVTHSICNERKKDNNLEIARKLYILDDICKEAELNNETPSLKHILRHFGGSKYNFNYKIEEDIIKYSFSELGDPTYKTAPVFTDELSGERTCVLEIPIEYIYHDDVINPRGINPSITKLVKEFYKHNPQLSLSLARIDDNIIKLFDGQHKTVAQILLSGKKVKKVLVRLFISPDVSRLIETNTKAGKELCQIAFDMSVIRKLHSKEYEQRLEQYRKDHKLPDDDMSFSEAQVAEYFKGDKIEKLIIDSQKDSVKGDSKIKEYLSLRGKDVRYPLSYSTFDKSILSLINSKYLLREPLGFKDKNGFNKRVLEKDNLVRICNLITEEFLIDKFDFDLGTNKIESKIANGKGDDIPDNHLIAFRLCKEEIMIAWMKWLKFIIKSYFANTGQMVDEKELLMSRFSDQLWNNIGIFLHRLHELPLWKDRARFNTLFSGKESVSYWETIFNTGSTPDGHPVLSEPFNAIRMIMPL